MPVLRLDKAFSLDEISLSLYNAVQGQETVDPLAEISYGQSLPLNVALLSELALSTF